MNYTIYIAADLDKDNRFFGEENKSGLVNRLLKEHYGLSDHENIKVNKDGTIAPIDVSKRASFTTKPIEYKERPSPVKKFNLKHCKQHGTPLTLEGKCLQKGH